MVEFLDTNATSSELNRLISKSNEKLYLISPYLQLSDKIKIMIQQSEKSSPSIDIKILYRSGKDSKINDDDRDFILKQLKNANLYALDNLHAKCYLNEHTAIIASMNLYQHSQENNWEMGVKIDNSSDPILYNDILKHALLLLNAGKKHEKKLVNFGNIVSRATQAAFTIKKVGKVMMEKSCYCVRCGKSIDYDMDRPLCPTCFKIWSKYADTKYQEKFCHYCGKARKTSVGKPVCYDCYKELNR
jgi:phosphatidylserine/phosphatidylglycerophosphate/cardiolipin synthase-like enzyme